MPSPYVLYNTHKRRQKVSVFLWCLFTRVVLDKGPVDRLLPLNGLLSLAIPKTISWITEASFPQAEYPSCCSADSVKIPKHYKGIM